MSEFACVLLDLICQQMIFYKHCKNKACHRCAISDDPATARVEKKLSHRIHIYGWDCVWECAWRGRACSRTFYCKCDTFLHWLSPSSDEFVCVWINYCLWHNVFHNLRKCTLASRSRPTFSCFFRQRWATWNCYCQGRWAGSKSKMRVMSTKQYIKSDFLAPLL